MAQAGERPQMRSRALKRYLFAALVAVELLMSFTFLGYIHLEPISLTIAYLPILIAGCFLGVGQSTAMGAVFGLASMYKASAYYVMPLDKIFSPFFSGFPLGSLFLSVGTRTLFGWLAGMLFGLAGKTRHPRFWVGVIATLSTRLHSLLVYSAMGLFFPEWGRGPLDALRMDAGDAALSLVCLLVIEGLLVLRRWGRFAGFGAYLEQKGGEGRKPGRLHWAWLVFLGCVFLTAAASTFYFAQRMAYMLEAHGLSLPETAEHDLLHLQAQALFATLALSFFLSVCLLVLYRYFGYREYFGQMDALTGVMGRKMFNHSCTQSLGSGNISPQGGWFLFVDVDYFKSINDTLGHPAGDQVLKKVAQTLQTAFSDHGSVGRIGGDEFALLLPGPVTQSELRGKLDRFLDEISGILAEPEKVTCSIGACRFTLPQELQKLYEQTDRLLYAAKRKGRACYLLGEMEGEEARLLDD